MVEREPYTIKFEGHAMIEVTNRLMAWLQGEPYVARFDVDPYEIATAALTLASYALEGREDPVGLVREVSEDAARLADARCSAEAPEHSDHAARFRSTPG
jgi:hypothetical protein